MKKLLTILIIHTMLTTTVIAQDRPLISDPNASLNFRPTITQTSAGVPAVHIVKPSASGMSHNKFTEYNVNQIGLVLNNSLNAGNTQLGGWISSNPNFENMTANAILAEVTGLNKSYIEGWTEIFGDQADFILANPNGVYVNGGGFINTPRVSLTTGVPSYLNDKLKLAVTSGDIEIGMAGLDSAGIQQLDVLSRKIKFNGTIASSQSTQPTAHSLNITAGANDYDYETGQTTQRGEDPLSDQYIIDGTIYSAFNGDKMKIVCTEAGAGVKLAGNYHTTNEYTLDADGNLYVGSVYSDGDINIKTTGDIQKEGVSSSLGNTTIQGNNIDNNQADIEAGENLDIKAAGYFNNNDSEIYVVGNVNVDSGADIDNTGNWLAGEKITITADGDVKNTSSNIISFRDIDIDTGSDKFIQDNGVLLSVYSEEDEAGLNNITLQGAGVSQTNDSYISTVDEITLNIAGDVLNDSSNIETEGIVSITASGDIDNTNGNILSNKETVTINAGSITSNSGGTIKSEKDLEITSTTDGINNTNGSLKSNQNVTITLAGNLESDSGVVSAGEKLTITSTSGVSNNAGTMTSNDTLKITNNSDLLDNTNGSISSSTSIVDIISGSLTNDSGSIVGISDTTITTTEGDISNKSGEISSNETLTIDSAGGIDSTGGVIESIKALFIKAGGEIKNKLGEITSDENVTIQNQTYNLDNEEGKIISGQSLDIKSGSINNYKGDIESNLALNLTADNADITNNEGTIYSNSNITIDASGNITNNDTNAMQYAGITALGTLTLDAGGNLESKNGYIVSNKDLNLTSGDTFDTSSGYVQTQELLTVNAGDINNSEGTLLSEKKLSLTTNISGIDNSQGLIHSNIESSIISEGVLNNNQGLISTPGILDINSKGITNTDGSIISTNDLTINNNGQTLTSNKGEISTEGKLNIQSGAIDNTSGLIEAIDDFNITSTGNITNSGGSIISSNTVTDESKIITTGTITNSKDTDNVAGEIISQNKLTIQSYDLNNTAGTIGANNLLDLTIINLLTNSDGKILSTGNLNLEIGKEWINDNGTLSANGILTMDVTNSTVDNQYGTITGDDLTLNSNGIFYNQYGTITANRLTVTSVNDFYNNYGVLESNSDLFLTAGENFYNDNGEVTAVDNITIDVGKSFNNSSGKVKANLDITIDVDETFTQSGTISSNEDLVITAKNMTNAGRTESNTSLSITTSEDLTHNSERIITNGNLTINSRDITNKSRITSGGTMDVDARNITNESHFSSMGNSDIRATGDFLNQSVLASMGDLTLYAGDDFINDDGDIFSLGNLTMTAVDEFILMMGDIQSEMDITLNANKFQSISEAYTGITQTFQDHGSEIYNLSYNEDQPALLNHDGMNWPDPAKDGWNRHGYWGYMDIFFDDRQDLSPYNLELMLYALFYSEPYKVLFRFSRGGYFHGGADYQADMDYKTTIQNIWNSLDSGSISAGGNFNLNAQEIENVGSTLSAGNNFTLTGTNLNNSQIILEAQYGYGGNFYWNPEVTDSIAGNIYAKNTLTVNMTGDVDNSGVMEGASVNVNAVNINNGIFNIYTVTPEITALDDIIDLANFSPDISTVDNSLTINEKSTKDMFTVSPTNSDYLIVSNFDIPMYGFALPDSPNMGITDSVIDDNQFTDANTFTNTTAKTIDQMKDEIAVQNNQKALADAIYEAKMISEAAKKDTGQLNFANNFATAIEQRNDYINNAIEFYNNNPGYLTFGQRATQEALDKLDKTIMWYETKEVTLPDGTTEEVLVPVIYMAEEDKNKKVDTKAGRIIAVDEQNLTADETLHNTGYLVSDDKININAKNVINEKRTAKVLMEFRSKGKWGKSSKKKVYVDVVQEGGEMIGKDINITTTGTPEDEDDENTGFINEGGKVVALDSLNINSNSDIINKAQKGTFLVQYDTGNLGRMMGIKDHDIGTYFVEGKLLANNNINLEAERRVKNIGSHIIAGNDINITAKELTKQDIESAVYKTGDKATLSFDFVKGMVAGFSRKKTYKTVTKRAEMIAGGDLTINVTEGDIENIGSTLTAADKLKLTASNDIKLEAKTIEVENDSKEFSQGWLGASYDEAKWNETKTELSELTATDIEIEAGRDVTSKGTIITAENNIDITAGRDVTLDMEQVKKYIEMKGFSAALDFFGADALRSAIGETNTSKTGAMMYQGPDSIMEELVKESSMTNSAYNLSKSDNNWDRVANATYLMKSVGDISGAMQGGGSLGGAFGQDAGLTDSGGNFSPTISVRFGTQKYKQNWTESHQTQVGAGNDINIDAGRDANIIGGTQVTAGNDLSVSAGNDVNIEAGADTNKTSFSDKGVTISYGASGFGVGADSTKMRSNGTTYTNATLTAGNTLTVTSNNDTNIKGGNLKGKEVIMDVGNDLNVESVQNKYESENKSWSVSVNQGKNMSGSFSKGDSNREWVDNATTIIGTEKVDIKVGQKTTLVGAIINAENGNLRIETPELEFRDINNSNESKQVSVSGSYTAKGGDSGDKGSNSIDASYSSSDKEGLTRATIGEGEIITGSDITGLNRDVENAEVVTKDDETYARVVAYEGMMDDAKKAGEKAKEVAKAAGEVAKYIVETPKRVKAIREAGRFIGEEDFSLRDMETEYQQGTSVDDSTLTMQEKFRMAVKGTEKTAEVLQEDKDIPFVDRVRKSVEEGVATFGEEGHIIANTKEDPIQRTLDHIDATKQTMILGMVSDPLRAPSLIKGIPNDVNGFIDDPSWAGGLQLFEDATALAEVGFAGTKLISGGVKAVGNVIKQADNIIDVADNFFDVSRNLLRSNTGGIKLGKGAGDVGDVGSNIAKTIKTPYGEAVQSTSEQAVKLREYVDNGGQLYRGGSLERTNVVEGQFWAPENPLNKGYANKYGVDFDKVEFVVGGKKSAGKSYVTRPAPGLASNSGRGIEVVTDSKSVELDFFHMPDQK